MANKDPKDCCHRSVNRVLDSYICIDCGAEFVPKDPAHRTKWSDDK